MESALYGTYTLVVFVSENSCVNTVRAHFLWSNLYLSYTYRDLRAKKHRDKTSLSALEKPAGPTIFFTGEKRRIDATIGDITICTSEQNHVARSPLLLADK